MCNGQKVFTPYHFPRESDKGFTLVEMIVSVALFAIVMTVCVDVLLALVNANRKAQALQSVMNNLNITLDGMVRPIREGSNFHCGSGLDTVPQDCPAGDTSFAFEPFGNATISDPPWVYTFAQDENGIGRIYKSVNGQAAIAITAPEVSIDDIKFYVVGTAHGGAPPDTVQPKVIIIIKGSAGAAGSKARTTFHTQATAVQRVLDL
jgi:prepilin-type N-terminal cleavage/methylation domain-containing protein